MSGGQEMTDIEFLSHQNDRRHHFIYLYQLNSGLLRSKVRACAAKIAAARGWNSSSIAEGVTPLSELTGPSLLGERLITCEAHEWRLEVMAATLKGIAADDFAHHALILVRTNNRLRELAVWREAIDRVGLIAEPMVTVGNYRSIARHLLRTSDFGDLDHLGDDKPFMARLKRFVQRDRTPVELGMKVDEVFLTQMGVGALLSDDAIVSRRGRLSELLNQFLTDPNTSTLHALLSLVDTDRRDMIDAEELLVRLYKATESIVAGRDRRYSRNRDGNPAFLPFLGWGMLLLASEFQLLHGNFVIAVEQICQEYPSVVRDARNWFAHSNVWQDIAANLQSDEREPTPLDQARASLQSALAERISGMPDLVELGWLVTSSTEAPTPGRGQFCLRGCAVMVQAGGDLSLLESSRPVSFAAVVGQEGLLRALKARANCRRDAEQHIAFVGAPGSGKMTVARLYSQMLICEAKSEDGSPCQTCSECRGVVTGSSLAYIKIDATEWRELGGKYSRDELRLRELIKVVQYSLYTAPYRIVVIDNAEQLSVAAADVLLKTLENETNTVFLFAVNDLSTFSGAVRSRCHVYRVRPVQADVLAGHLARICRRHQIPHELPALRVIARASNGLCGIAVHMLDQVARGGDVTAAAARAKLGLNWAHAMLRCWRAIFSGLSDEALSRFERIGSDGPTRVGAMQAYLLELHLRHELGTRAYPISPALDELSETDWAGALNEWERFAQAQSPEAGNLITEVMEFWGGIRPDVPWRTSFRKAYEFLVYRGGDPKLCTGSEPAAAL